MIPAEDSNTPRALIRRLVDAQPTGTAPLRRICSAAVEVLSASGAGISVMTTDGTRGVCATSDPVSERVEELQFILGEGPCIDAFTARRPILAADLSDGGDLRWPVYAPAARGAGIQAVFAFPLQVGAARLGVMDVFRDRTGPLSGTELQLALTLAEITVDALLDWQQGTTRGGDVVLDVGHRAELFQAQGMVMMQLGVSISEALVRIRAHAYAENRRLDDVASDIVEGRLRLDG